MSWSLRAALAVAVALALVASAGCRKDAPEPPNADDDAGPRRRVFDPPPGQVRAVWPHEIRSDGVGPYLLGAPLEEIFDLLPGGPRIEILQVEGVANYNVVRGEGELLVIGAGRRGPVEFIAVVGTEVARTSSGAGVGVVGERLDEALGPPLASAGRRATDPRVRTYASQPGVRFLLGEEAVEAVVVVGAPGADPAADDDTDDCDRDAAIDDAAVLAMGAGLPADAPVLAGCFWPSGAQVLSFGDEQLAVVSRRGTGAGRVARLPVPGLIYAAPLDIDDDGRDEIVAVARTTGETTLEYSVVVVRVDPARMVAIATESLYEVTRMGAALTGAELPEVDLYVWMERQRSGRLRVGGVYVHRERGVVRDAAPLLPRVVDVRRRRPLASRSLEGGDGQGDGDGEGQDGEADGDGAMTMDPGVAPRAPIGADPESPPGPVQVPGAANRQGPTPPLVGPRLDRR